jgi:hypothetical protein
MTVIYPNGHKIYKNFPFYGLPTFIQMGIFGLKIYHLATLSLTTDTVPLRKSRCDEKPSMTNCGQNASLAVGQNCVHYATAAYVHKPKHFN